MQLPFSKYEGLGNDFLLVEEGPATSLGPEEAIALCDRHFGVGGDGVLLLSERGGSPFMRVINADGSRPEMCGNGLRCAALYFVHEGRVSGSVFDVDTDAGPHTCRVTRAGETAQVQVSMPPASLNAASVLLEAQGSVVDAPFEVGGQSLRGTAISTGNPHFVLFDVPVQDQDRLGPELTGDPRFIAGANVGFARMTSREGMELRVHERGAAWTMACGTGACAAAVAAVETGRATRGEAITVRLPGGPLEIIVPAAGQPISMTGPARRVFRGSVALPFKARA